MKKLSRLTALLLAIVMLLSTTAIAEDGFPQSEFDLQRYNQMHNDVQQRGLIDSAYEHYVQELAKLDTAARYAKLVSWHDSGLLGDIFYSSFVNYYKTAHPNGTLICTCASPLPYGGEGHADGCPWKPVAGTELKDEASGVSVVGEIPAGIQLNVEETAVAEIADLTYTDEYFQQTLENINENHKMFDITMLQNARSEEWQPGEGETVSVSLDVSDLGENGDDMLVYHIHQNEDGSYTPELMGPFMVEDGKINFSMSGFSYVLVLSGTATHTIKDVKVFYPVISAPSGNGHLQFLGVYYDNNDDLHVLLASVDDKPSAVEDQIGVFFVDEGQVKLATAGDKAQLEDVQTFSKVELKDQETVLETIKITEKKGIANGFFDINFEKLDIGRNFEFAVSHKSDNRPTGSQGWNIIGGVSLKLDYQINKTVLAGTSANVSNDAWKETETVERGDWVVFRIEINNLGDRELTDMVIKDILPDEVFDLSSVQKSIDVYDEASGTWIVGDWSDFNLETENLLDDVGESGTTYDGAPKFSRSMYLLARVRNDLPFAVGQASREFINTATIDGMNMPTYSDTAKVIINGPKEGTLTIKKAVTAENPNDPIDSQKAFRFTVTGANGYFEEFWLTNNKKMELTNVPTGSYTVTETLENGYATSITGPDGTTMSGLSYTGTMLSNDAPIVAFENKKGMETGSLKVSKAVIGIDAPAEDTFTFSVVFTGKDLPNAFSYTKSVDTIADVVWTVVDTDDVDTLTGTLVLKKNENVVFNNLPTNISYKVTEAAKAGYTADAEVKSGTISASESVAAFTNSYNFGSLEISKTVTGAPANWPAETFTFKIELSDTTLTGTYSEVEFNQGVATVQLQGGHSKKISGLPKDATYTVTETPNAAYKTTVNGNDTNVATGTISNTATATAAFNNELRVGTLNITKTVRQSDFNGGSFAFEVLDASDKVVATGDSTSIALTADKKTGSIAAPITLVAGEYTVKELTTDGYNTTMQIDSADAASVTEIQVIIEPGELTMVNVVNTATGNYPPVRVKKTWEDNNNTLKRRPESISVTLTGKVGEEVKYPATEPTWTIPETGNEWTGVWNNVPMYDGSGNRIVYEAAEADIPNYTKGAVDGDVSRGYSVTNSIAVGDLTISKTVADADPNDEVRPDLAKEFTFTVTLPDGIYKYTGSKTGEIANGGTITLKHGESVTIQNLPKDADYAVAESAPGAGYTEQPSISGKITAGSTATAAFTNTFKVADLTITKDIVGGDANTDDDVFTFSVKIGGTTTEHKITGKGTVTIPDIPIGTSYTVTETDLPTGYSIDEAEKTVTGNISEDGNTATFTNTYTTGSLVISKTVVGKDAPSSDTFTFTVGLPAGTFNYTIGQTTGTIADGGTITLAHGQTATITGIPAGATYTVTETADDDYTTTKPVESGEITANAPQTAAFTNTYKTGNLAITKSGLDDGDHAIFNVTVTKGNYNKTFRIVMTNETVKLVDLPYNATYTVAEESGWAWRYGTTTITYEDQGKTIDYNETDTVTVVNEKTENKWLDFEEAIENLFNGVQPSEAPNS